MKQKIKSRDGDHIESCRRVIRTADAIVLGWAITEIIKMGGLW